MTSFPAYLIRKSDKSGEVSARIERLSLDELPIGDVLIRVEYSSLNYKDGLACEGHPGVVRSFPHIAGIDAAGVVQASSDSEFQIGDEVIVTGYDLGAGHWGGFSRYIRVPAEWIVPCPSGLTLRECMAYGTAGFTAAQAVWAICEHVVAPDCEPIVVTGATGGVGSIAVAILSQLGYEVHAVTGKRDAAEYLNRLGAAKVIAREDVTDVSNRPLLSARWSAAVDTVGGQILSTIIRQTGHRGCVTACGLVAGADLPLTVHPFILRGVSLAGIDSAQCPMARRREIWGKLAGPWKVRELSLTVNEIAMSELPEKVRAILKGLIRGRTVVRTSQGN